MNQAISVLGRVCLPSAPLERALRVALWNPDLAAAEWTAWQADPVPANTALRDPEYRLRRLFPLIEASLRRSQARLDKPLRDYLRMGAAHEQMRWEVAERVTATALDALLRSDVEFLVLRGVALATSLYAHPSLRHCHDLDLLVREGESERAARSLMESGFVNASAPPGSEAASRWVKHPTGFPIGIHEKLFRLAPWNSRDPNLQDHLFSHSHPQEVAGHLVRTLLPEEMLAAVCIHAVTVGSRHSPGWVTDAWHILVNNTALDWNRVISFGPALPLCLTLDWLRRELQAPVPKAVIGSLQEAILATDPAIMKQATAAALLCAHGRPGDVIRSAKISGARLAWLRQLAAPDATVLRWTEHSAEPLPILHYRRLRRFIGGFRT